MSKLSFGSYYFSTPAVTTLSASTPALAAGTTTVGAEADFTGAATNRTTYTQATTRTFKVQFTGSVSKGGGGSTEALAYLYKTGNPIAGAVSVRTVANPSDNGAFSVSALTTLGTGDYIELWLETDSGDDLTIEAGTMTVHSIG